MPTGYTAGVADGKVTDFPTFALTCARAFGALIEMRDSAIDAATPDEFKPSPYYAEQIAQREVEIAQLQAMTPGEAQSAAAAAHAQALARWQERRAERAEKRARYEAMLAEARAWEPPTAEHDGLRRFMVEQLEESIRFDCSATYDETPPQPWDASEWMAGQLGEAVRSLEYARKHHEEEVERASGRTAWVRALRESLAVETSVST